MGAGQVIMKQFTPTKMAFNIIFWGIHWGLFALGWYVTACLQHQNPDYWRIADGVVRTGTCKKAIIGWPA